MLKDVVQIFLESEEQDVITLSDPVWLRDLCFAVDITERLSNLNLKSQGKDKITFAINDNSSVS